MPQIAKNDHFSSSFQGLFQHMQLLVEFIVLMALT